MTETRAGKPIVRFESVFKSYDGENLVVQDLNLDVYRGEFLTLLGPSGSGKTTTLMMLAGFEAPTEGRIVLNDQKIGNLAPYKRGIGVVFQNYALFPHMTVAENIAFPLVVRKLDKAEIETRTGRALELVKLGGFGARRPRQLSGTSRRMMSGLNWRADSRALSEWFSTRMRYSPVRSRFMRRRSVKASSSSTTKIFFMGGRRSVRGMNIRIVGKGGASELRVGCHKHT